ncbi:MAG: hypothetical protein U0136_15880 [Bdellovibrionota bacterium]
MEQSFATRSLALLGVALCVPLFVATPAVAQTDGSANTAPNVPGTTNGGANTTASTPNTGASIGSAGTATGQPATDSRQTPPGTSSGVDLSATGNGSDVDTHVSAPGKRGATDSAGRNSRNRGENRAEVGPDDTMNNNTLDRDTADGGMTDELTDQGPMRSR